MRRGHGSETPDRVALVLPCQKVLGQIDFLVHEVDLDVFIGGRGDLLEALHDETRSTKALRTTLFI